MNSGDLMAVACSALTVLSLMLPAHSIAAQCCGAAAVGVGVLILARLVSGGSSR